MLGTGARGVGVVWCSAGGVRIEKLRGAKDEKDDSLVSREEAIVVVVGR